MPDRRIVSTSQVPDPESFHLLVADYQSYQEMEKAAQEGKKQTAARILSIIQSLDVDAIDANGQRFASGSTTTSRVSKERLLERGVAPEIILYATLTTESQPFLRVSNLSRE